MAALFALQRKPREFRHTTHVQELSDKEMASRYRFTNYGIDCLEELLQDQLERPTNRNKALTVRQMLLLTLRYLASGAFFSLIGDSMGYHRCTVSRVVLLVVEAVCAHIHTFIVWPDAREKSISMSEFYKVAGFPNIIGCIDGTHIEIQAPEIDEPAFCNRKIITQSICRQCVTTCMPYRLVC